jgi:hypothetical protein
MKKAITIFLVSSLLSGCTILNIEQSDASSTDRIVTTKVKAVAWFSSAQAITKLKVIQTDKSQSTGTDSLSQQGATNSVEALKAIAHILELLKPVP